MKRRAILHCLFTLVLCLLTFALTDASGVVHATTGTVISLAGCKTWKVIPSPNPVTQSAVLNGVVALSTSNVWAVGYSYKTGSSSTLVEHWDGNSWTIVSSPEPGSGNFYGVARVPGTGQLWTVGSYNNNGNGQTLIEQWNGSSWSIVPSPNVGTTNNMLNKVVALSTNDAWAVGLAYSSEFEQTLVEHWDGSSWTVVPSPGNFYPVLNGVKAVSASNIWAVGTIGRYTLIEHWDGSSWSIVPSPNVTSSNVLEDVDSIAANNIWAVGVYGMNSNSYTLIEHWNGTSWKIVSSSSPGSVGNILYGITRVPGTSRLWTVGERFDGSISSTLIEFHC